MILAPRYCLPIPSSGQPGWLAVLESPKVKGIVSFEPGTYVFPTGEVPPFATGTPLEFGPADYLKLTQIPILVIFGDNLDTVPGRVERLATARAFAETLNNNGGNAKVIHLPEVGIFGNGHALFFERNNVQIADLISEWLKSNGLDKH
jgi:pimeloyl-ACP methyl ester carboxylesterase